MGPLFQLLLSLVTTMFQKVANDLWDMFWAQLFDAISEAENKWQNPGDGKQKREWVVQTLNNFILDKATASGRNLSWLDKRILNIFVGNVVDTVLGYINDALGHDWRTKAEELERKWAASLPVID